MAKPQFQHSGHGLALSRLLPRRTLEVGNPFVTGLGASGAAATLKAEIVARCGPVERT